MGIKARVYRALRFMRAAVIVLLWAAAVAGFHYSFSWPKELSIFLFLALLSAGMMARSLKLLAICVIIGFAGMLAAVARVQPSNDRPWAAEFAVLPRIEIAGSQVTIQGVRNFRWHDSSTFDAVWQQRDFDLKKLTSLELIVEPFKGSELMAHTMLQFGFGEEGSLIVSVEARREEHERYSLVPGAFRQFELIYLFGDEHDLLELRAVHRGTRLYAYPVKADREFMASLFLDLAASANALHSQPKFYRSLRDNCTTTLVKHIDRMHLEHIGLRYETVFPALTGRLLYERGFMDTDLSYEEARTLFRVDERIRNR